MKQTDTIRSETGLTCTREHVFLINPKFWAFLKISEQRNSPLFDNFRNSNGMFLKLGTNIKNKFEENKSKAYLF